MRIPSLIPVFTLFWLFAGSVLLLPGQGHAGCDNPCMCGWGCYDGCQCPGTNGCAWCAVPDSENLQLKTSPSEPMNIKVEKEPVPATIIHASNIDRLIRRIGTGLKIGQCPQNNFRLQVTGEDSLLKVDQILSKDNVIQENAVAFQIAKK